MDCRNSLVRSDESVLTTVVGLDDVIVVSTADAVLVASRDKAETGQGTGRTAQAAQSSRRGRAPPHLPSLGLLPGRRYCRPLSCQAHCGEAGQPLSLQKHFHRSEHWVVVQGTAEVTTGNDVRTVHENESIYIPIGSIHRLANPGKIPLELIEVQVGSYLGEDDIVRLDDVYDRK